MGDLRRRELKASPVTPEGCLRKAQEGTASSDTDAVAEIRLQRRSRFARALGSLVSTDATTAGSARRGDMFDADDVDAFIAIRAGIWAGADDLPCTIWSEFHQPTIERLLDIIPVDEPGSI